MTEAGYRAREFSAQDGTRLFFRDYGDANARATPVLCLPGLTRNSADFHDLALTLAATRRVLALDLRGRGLSDRDADGKSYTNDSYLADIGHLLTLTGCHHIAVVGTSLGGILAMGLGATRPTALRAVVLNDIGPEVPGAALADLQRDLERLAAPSSLKDAARLLRETQGAAFPDLDDGDWDEEAARRYERGADGRAEVRYDPAILQSLAALPAGEGLTFWDSFMALEQIPTLAIRGELSGILRPETLDEMARRKPDLEGLVVARQGHAPRLAERETISAIAAFLDAVDGQGDGRGDAR